MLTSKLGQQPFSVTKNDEVGLTSFHIVFGSTTEQRTGNIGDGKQYNW